MSRRIDPDDFEPDIAGPTDEELDALESETVDFINEDMAFSSSSDKLDEIMEKNEELTRMVEDLNKKIDLLMQSVNALRRK